MSINRARSDMLKRTAIYVASGCRTCVYLCNTDRILTEYDPNSILQTVWNLGGSVMFSAAISLFYADPVVTL